MLHFLKSYILLNLIQDQIPSQKKIHFVTVRYVFFAYQKNGTLIIYSIKFQTFLRKIE